MPKRAIVYVNSIAIACPHCDALQPNNEGSLYFTREEFDATERKIRESNCDCLPIATCHECERKFMFKIPASLEALFKQ